MGKLVVVGTVAFDAIETPFEFQLVNTTMQGWYIDNFRFGDKLPSSEWMDIKKIYPSDSNGDNSPNGYGLLDYRQHRVEY